MKTIKFIFAIFILFSCQSVNIESSKLVVLMIENPEKYKDILIDTNNVFSFVKFSKRFEEQLLNIKENKWKLLKSEEFIYDGIKYIKYTYSDSLNNELILLSFTFKKSLNNNKWKMSNHYFINKKLE